MTDTTTPTPDGVFERLGFTDRERALFAPMAEKGFERARVARVDRGLPLVATETGLERAEPATHLVKTADASMSRAVVGDWVALARPAGHDMPIIEAILPRHSKFARKDPGEEGGEQVLIANVDVVFVVQSLSGSGVNVSRLERELVLAWESGARPVVVLTKDDLSENTMEQKQIAEEVAFGADVIIESAVNGVGIDEVLAAVPLGVTAALLGSSGVGKSTLVNRLVGSELQETGSVREADDKGRHVTVARELVLVPGGGVIIDTPGMRAVALWEAADGMVAAFPEIELLAEKCRFRDCQHENEPGCAVVAAVASGDVPQRRLDSYLKLTTELADLARRQDQKAWAEKDSKMKEIAKVARRFYKSETKGKGR